MPESQPRAFNSCNDVPWSRFGTHQSFVIYEVNSPSEVLDNHISILLTTGMVEPTGTRSLPISQDINQCCSGWN